MTKALIYHNPRCTKSRETLALIEENKVEAEIIEYLKTPPGAPELKAILKKLGMKAADIVRKSEELYKSRYKDKKFSEEEWIKILVKNPVLIERPIVVIGNKAIIGRPPENVLTILP
jgi:arsenate reductase